jgi:hypothetical protein
MLPAFVASFNKYTTIRICSVSENYCLCHVQLRLTAPSPTPPPQASRVSTPPTCPTPHDPGKGSTITFDTKLYTGNGSTQTISGLAFSPDFGVVKSAAVLRQQSHCTTQIRGAS